MDGFAAVLREAMDPYEADMLYQILYGNVFFNNSGRAVPNRDKWIAERVA